MKYLKKFNEELKPRTYRSAAHKLKKMGHVNRSKDLEDWADKIESDQNLVKWEKAKQIFSPYGKFKVKTTNPKTKETCEGDFYLDIVFDELSFIESIDENRPGIWFHIGCIPVDEETKERFDNFFMALLCSSFSCLPDPDMGNGFYWMLSAGIEYVRKENKIEFVKFYIDYYDNYVGGNARLSDRGSAGRFKNLLINLFTDPTLNYPSGHRNVDTIHELFERSILSESGFSSEYGLTLEDVANYIRTISPNTMYKV